MAKIVKKNQTLNEFVDPIQMQYQLNMVVGKIFMSYRIDVD